MFFHSKRLRFHLQKDLDKLSAQKPAKRAQTVEFYPPENLDAAQIGYIYGEKSIKKLTAALLISLFPSAKRS